jgi:hypothetical protein
LLQSQLKLFQPIFNSEFKFSFVPWFKSKWFKTTPKQFHFWQTWYLCCSVFHVLSNYEVCFSFWINKIWTYLKSEVNWSNMA